MRPSIIPTPLLPIAALSITLATAVVANATAAPVCGDVNNSTSVTSSDALLVLKKGVGQNVTLNCTAYDNQISTCAGNLSTTNADLGTCKTDLSSTNADLADCVSKSQQVCGNGILEGSEQCDDGVPFDETCKDEGYAGGKVGCSIGCKLDFSRCYYARFDAVGASIIDRQTGLEWEKKDGDDATANLADPHDVDNGYAWSLNNGQSNPDGAAFTDFLRKLNGGVSSDGTVTSGCYAGHCDWRLPTPEELATILVPGCASPPCVVDPALLPTKQVVYWTSATLASGAGFAFGGHFKFGSISSYGKVNAPAVRAVRGGSAGSCPASGALVGGACWFLGAMGADCDTACAAKSLDYDPATETIAGSSGSDDSCKAVLDAVGAAGRGLDYPSFPYTIALGCSVDDHNRRSRVTSPATTSTAFFVQNARACACK